MRWSALLLWLDAGTGLGDHLHSHLNVNNVALAEFTADITRGEPVLRAVLETRGRTRYFRHPFLFTGPTPDIKAGLQAFLDQQGYVVAPVTFDNGFSGAAKRSSRSRKRSPTRPIDCPTTTSGAAGSRGFTAGRARKGSRSRRSPSRPSGRPRVGRTAEGRRRVSS